MSIFIWVNAIYRDSGQRLFADEIIFIQADKRELASDCHSKAVWAASVDRYTIIKYSFLIVPVSDGLVAIIIGDHAAIAVVGKSVTGKLCSGVVVALYKRSDFPSAHSNDVSYGKLGSGGVGWCKRRID